MKREIIDKLIDIVGSDYVAYQGDQVEGYLYDQTENVIRPMANKDCVVVKPRNPEEISQVLKYANEVLVSVVPRGGGTGLCGAVIPSRPSIILSMERFKDIIEVDEDNLMITLEAGVTLGEMNEALLKYDKLFFPCHPGDISAQIGGLVVENAGGARAIRHGVMRNHVKGVEVVLPTGEIVKWGGKLVKNNAGYDLLHLLMGSEGTLGIVTKATIRLYCESGSSCTLVVSFETCEDAISVVPKILKKGITPLAIEYVDKDVILKAADHLGENWPSKKGNVDLIFILSEAKEEDLYENCEVIEEICSQCGAIETLMADNPKEQARILTIRSNTYTATADEFADSLDITVPPASVPQVMKEFNKITAHYNTSISSVGHLGDGNLHNVIKRVDGKVPSYYEEMKEDMYKVAIEHGGTITGEHGIGKLRMKHMHLQFSPVELKIMKGIKKVFDPNNILNPDTII